jgi:IS5 family transposase
MAGVQVETLWDELLPLAVRELPPDLAALDRLLADERVLEPIRRHWHGEAAQRGRSTVGHGRPTVPMATYVRLMLIKQRSGWGYETLVREVSDSLHLRRFCLLAVHADVPHESTLRKLTLRLGPDVVADITRVLIGLAQRERRFRARALRCDSTVVEADIRYPSDAALAVDATRALARHGRRLRAQLDETACPRVRDRSRATARRLRLIGRTVSRRRGEARQTVLRLTGETAVLIRRSLREARGLLERARASSGATAHGAAARLASVADQAERVARQIDQRLRGERISDRLVSLADPDARPIGKGKLGKPYEFGYVVQLAELTPNTRRGTRGLILPPATGIGSPNETELLPTTVAELGRVGAAPREAAFDGGFDPITIARILPQGVDAFVAGRAQHRSPRSRRRLARYRVGCEARISHLKRRYGLRRSRLRGERGVRIWIGWSVLAYNLDTLAANAS